MIKPVTFKAAQNFKANLYALEMRSRFADRDNANGYYEGYGDELAATLIGTSAIRIGSGALLVQGRMVEIVSSETVNVAYEEGKVGFVICRIETSPGGEHCSLFAKTDNTFEDISIVQENTYQYEAEDENRTYELPLYSFTMQNGAIGSLQRLIGAVYEFAEIVKKIYPIGSIYMSVVDTSPALLFGGVWSRWGEGRVPLGVDPNISLWGTAGLTGGEYVHELTEEEMPRHTHGAAGRWPITLTDGGMGPHKNYMYYGTVDTVQEDDYSGGNVPHNNMQPYITCHMWKRIG